MSPVSGIGLANGPTGPRAVIGGTGIDVWEVISSWKANEADFSLLCEDYPWLTGVQLRSALEYYRLHREEIDARLEAERYWTPERLREELPFLVPCRKEGPLLSRREGCGVMEP